MRGLKKKSFNQVSLIIRLLGKKGKLLPATRGSETDKCLDKSCSIQAPALPTGLLSAVLLQTSSRTHKTEMVTLPPCSQQLPESQTRGANFLKQSRIMTGGHAYTVFAVPIRPIETHAHICIYIYIYTHTYLSRIHIPSHTCRYTHRHTHVHTHTHISYIYIYIHLYIYLSVGPWVYPFLGNPCLHLLSEAKSDFFDFRGRATLGAACGTIKALAEEY